MPLRWNEIPFVYHFVNFKGNDVELSLPFAVGGATQQGTDHILNNYNNQDALSILTGNEFLVGTVCDGCTSTHDELRNIFSNNEVAARLLAYAVTSNVKKLLKRTRIKDPSSFVQTLSKITSRQLVSLVKTLAGDDEKEREVFIFDFLMSTIIGFAVTREHYLLFGSGDGIIGVNNQITILEEAGSYFATSILQECCPSRYTKTSDSYNLKVLSSGSTSDIQNIFLATDGFREIAQNYNQTLIGFLDNSATRPKGGFDFLLFEFRKRILENNTIEQYSLTSNWPRDDASFLLLRRTDSNLSLKSESPDELLIKELQNDSDDQK